MKTNLNRTLIETTIRNSIRHIKNDPERSMRNLVDMALSFSNGRFQKHFLEITQTMLQNETSSYYKIIPALVTNSDEERIVTYGMNIGYNGCTLGARIIRDLEAKESFNIPWSVFLELKSNSYYTHKAHYHSLLSNGKGMGIYVWNIYTLENPSYILELAEEFSECAFNIFCTPENITQDLLDDAKNIYNVLFLVKYGYGMEEACDLLRSQGFLYSIYYNDEISDYNPDKIDEILIDTENRNAVFTVFLSQPHLPLEADELYRYILQIRSEQKYQTIPFDFVHDNYSIDHIISDQACAIKVSSDGACHSLMSNNIYENCNIFQCSLFDILKTISFL